MKKIYKSFLLVLLLNNLSFAFERVDDEGLSMISGSNSIVTTEQFNLTDNNGNKVVVQSAKLGSLIAPQISSVQQALNDMQEAFQLSVDALPDGYDFYNSEHHKKVSQYVKARKLLQRFNSLLGK